MAPLWNFSFASAQGNVSVLGINQASSDELIPHKQGENIGRGCHTFERYSHIVDHIPRSNKTLFLIPLIVNFFSDNVSSLLPQVACNFQNRSTNILWGSKRSVSISWIFWWAESSIQIGSFRGSMVVCRIGSIICFLLSMAKDKNFLRHNCMGRKYDLLSSILTHTQVVVSWRTLQRLSYFLHGRKKQPSIYFYFR